MTDPQNIPRPEAAPGEPTGLGYETRDTKTGMIVGFGIGLVIVLVVVMLGLRALAGVIARDRGPMPPEQAPAGVQEDLRALRAEEQSTLTDYGRIAHQPGYAHIPIERAMEIMVKEKGVPFGKGRKTEVEVQTRVKQ
jgi:hypothetical protein